MRILIRVLAVACQWLRRLDIVTRAGPQLEEPTTLTLAQLDPSKNT